MECENMSLLGPLIILGMLVLFVVLTLTEENIPKWKSKKYEEIKKK